MHSFLSASKPSWTNYDEDKLDRVYTTHQAAQRGTALHAYAAMAILLGQRQPRTPTTINMFVNDAIGFRMQPEQVLFYSINCFGTTDALGFDRAKKLLRVHDLKTGISPAPFTQLEVYAALFCLEYRVRVFDITVEMRIYQNDEIKTLVADPDRIIQIMDKIITFDKRIEELKEEASR